MTDIQKLDELGRLGRDLIEVQLVLASKKAKDALNDLWVLGYFYGVFDALGQAAKLAQNKEDIVLIQIGFSLLLGDHLEGADAVGLVIHNQKNSALMKGITAGGGDIYKFLADKSQAPLSLSAYLIPTEG
jgi:hypothetical protein